MPLDGRLSLQQRAEHAPPYAALTPWARNPHWLCYSTGEALAGWYETVRRLFIGMFMLRDTLLDQPRYQAAYAAFDAATVIRTLADLPLMSLRAMPFKIRPTGQKLYDLLVPLQRYAQALERFDVAAARQADREHLAHKAAHLERQVDMNLEQLRTALTTLHWRCGDVGVVWREPWDTALETLNGLTPEMVRDLHTQVIALQHTIDDDPAHPWDVWRYQEFRQRARPVLEHPYWAATATLHTIQQELRRVARTRYRSTSRMLTGTSEYRALLETVRAIRQEVRDG
jgi:hypothetical protein